MKTNLSYLAISAGLALLTISSCKKDEVIPVIPPSDGKEVTLNLLAGSEATGDKALNSAFIDFSSDEITISGRADWDLAFYSGSDFRVTLNYKTAALTTAINKNDLTQVTGADTIGLPLSLTYSAADFAKIDSITGDLAYTRIPVNATASDNKVYIIQRGTGAGITARPWYKVRVLRNGQGGYTLQYARITETTFKTIEITKDAQYNFQFVSFDNGIVSVEPKKADWDIQYTAAFDKYPFGDGFIPYFFSDFVLINYLGGTQVSEVLTADHPYTAITLTDATSLTYSGNRLAIADKWRTLTSVASPSVLADRFYVIKDVAGNYYKLKFISFHDKEGGTRGKPEIEYKLIK